MGEKKEFQVLSSAVGFAAVSVSLALFLNASDSNSSWIFRGILGSILSASFLANLVCLDIWRLQPADSHTLGTLLSQYIAISKLRIMAPFVRRSIDQMTREDAQKTTTNTLLQIIRLNQKTEYGIKYKFSEIQSINDFTRLHPLTSYEHYRSIIGRIKAGERNIMYFGNTALLATTSGTTGEVKLLPLTSDFIMKARNAIEDMFIMNSLIPMISMKRVLRFHLFSPVEMSSGGIPIGAASQAIHSFPKHNLIPVEYQKLTKEDSSYYAMAVFALAEKELSHIDTFSPDLMNAFMKFMVKHWENICHDIETGTIGKAVEMPEEVRVSLSTHLQADPARADYLRKVLKKGPVGIAKRAWPDLIYITMSKSAGFKMLSTKLIKNHFKGVKVIGFMHGGSEGYCGVNFETEHREGDTGEIFTFNPKFCFMEFIPLEAIKEKDPKVVQLHQLEEGNCYEIAITNENGLYRCRYGDIIKVVGYANNIPKYEFVYRLGQTLNIAYERTPDTFLIDALFKAKSALSITSEISDFITTESTVSEEITGYSSKGHYIFFIEFDDKLEPVSDLARKVDQCLRDSYDPYNFDRDIESIGDLEVIQVKPGTMDGIRSILMGAKVNPQFKMPRVLRVLPAIRHLIANKMTK